MSADWGLPRFGGIEGQATAWPDWLCSDGSGSTRLGAKEYENDCWSSGWFDCLLWGCRHAYDAGQRLCSGASQRGSAAGGDRTFMNRQPMGPEIGRLDFDGCSVCQSQLGCQDDERAKAGLLPP